MKMVELKQKAESLNVQPGKKKKADLVHAIQQAEGNNPCFGTTDGQCHNTNCCFMQDCLGSRN